MLVVDSIVPGSHAEHLLEPGDVLIKVEGRVVTHFLTLEDILDSAVNKAVVLEVERGGQPVRVTVQVKLVDRQHQRLITNLLVVLSTTCSLPAWLLSSAACLRILGAFVQPIVADMSNQDSSQPSKYNHISCPEAGQFCAE